MRIAIIGAGSVGAMLADELLNNPKAVYKPVCFVDVNKEKNSRKNFIIFIVFSIIGLGLTELIMWFGTDVIKINYLIVKIIATGIVMIFNFITRKIFLE